MDLFRYVAGPSVHHLPVTPYEAHLLSRVEPKQPHERGVLAVPEAGVVRSVPRGELLESARRLASVLQRDDALQQYRYSLKEQAPGQPGHGGGGGRTCRFMSEHAVVEAGPGFCQIVASDVLHIDAVALVERRRLRDLRDMQPVALDDGTIVAAQRRRRPVALAQSVAQFVAFLEASEAPTIECSVERNAAPR